MQEFLITSLIVLFVCASFLAFKLSRLKLIYKFLHTQDQELKTQNEAIKLENESLKLDLKELKESLIKTQSKLDAQELNLASKDEYLRLQKLEFEKEKANLKAEFQEKEQSLLHTHAEAQNKLFKEQKASLNELELKYKANLESLKFEFEKSLEKQHELLLTQNKNMLSDESKKILDELFTPLKTSVKAYHEKLAHNEIELKTNIKNMFEYSQKISQNAEQLANILKGDKKTRGNFAELQLKSVLEHSGLKEGVQYKLQEHLKLDGKSYYPDAVVYLDHQKSIIIDAKFSLPNDFDFNQNDRQICEQLALNIKARINELASKPYTHFDTHTYDFVLLFLPYQNILDLALEHSPNLYKEAYEKKIYLTTPHTLFMALNTINIAWRHIQSNDNVMKAFEALAKFHDKFVSFVEDFEGVKRAFSTLENKLDAAEKKLLRGSGNLASRFHQLKELGVKTSKELKAEFDEGILEPQDKPFLAQNSHENQKKEADENALF
ncbi:DNA recombination protein RmuC [Campylobacter sp. MIT 12-5580]|uniref:DNA recombination protein RmuC n=1 Tax=Campylobacter sp. MIT 12-5580 TaxID=2040651 RepID=UPI0010F561C6|nr:DNA recombination protein RmuC [Campylobacter sp. MIT 12-5580]